MSALQKMARMGDEELRAHLLVCCHAAKWADKLVQEKPFGSREELMQRSSDIWLTMEDSDLMEAFAAHPKIGEQSLKEKFGTNQHSQWASVEQAGVQGADDQVLKDLADLNEKYHEKFGYVFLICATGKTAQQMLDLLKGRIEHTAHPELRIAAGEQNKITTIRLDKLLSQLSETVVTHEPPRAPPLTTHVLDTASGGPASGLTITLEIQTEARVFEFVNSLVTNNDGRVDSSLIPDRTMRAAVYRITFDTASYFASKQQKCFYPSVSVVFEITSPEEHYHVPLLVSPYGYSTYRGS